VVARNSLEEAIITRGGNFMSLQGLALAELGLEPRDASVLPVSAIVRDSNDSSNNQSATEEISNVPLIKEENDNVMKIDPGVFLISTSSSASTEGVQLQRWTKAFQTVYGNTDKLIRTSKNYFDFASISPKKLPSVNTPSLPPPSATSSPVISQGTYISCSTCIYVYVHSVCIKIHSIKCVDLYIIIYMFVFIGLPAISVLPPVPPPSLTEAPAVAVKRSYIPRKRNEGSFDATGEIYLNTSNILKLDLKKDKKKFSLVPNSDSSPSFASLSSSIPVPWKEEETVPPPGEQSQSSQSQGPKAASNGGNAEEEIMYESCWAADRLAETILSCSSDKTKKRDVFSVGDDLLVPGLFLGMAYTITRNWQHREHIENENAIAGSLPVKCSPPIVIATNPSASSTIPPVPPTPTHSLPANVDSCEIPAPTSFIPSHIEIPSLPIKVRTEPEPEVNNTNTAVESRGRLNRNYLSELDRLRLRRAGVGVSKAEKVFWSLIEPFVNVPLNKPKEVQRIRPPGQFVVNNLLGSYASSQAPSLPQPYSALSFQESIRELKRKGISIDSHMYFHPLQNTMRCDLQSVPSWQRKSTISDTHNQFNIQYIAHRLESSKSSLVNKKAGGGARGITTRGVEREKEPVRKRVLDQTILIPNIRMVRTKLETGVASRSTALGGTVNPLFTRLPPIRIVLKSRRKSIGPLKGFTIFFSRFAVLITSYKVISF
jgi:hypothetical protein